MQPVITSYFCILLLKSVASLHFFFNTLLYKILRSNVKGKNKKAKKTSL